MTYSLEEDRICVDGASSTGKRLRLWFTARLLNRLVPHLVARQLEYGAEISTENEVLSAVEGHPEDAEERVTCGPEHPEILVAKILLSVRESQVVLTFKNSDGEKKAVFGMPLELLEKWNRGLKYCYQQAGWLQDSFTIESARSLEGRRSVTIH